MSTILKKLESLSLSANFGTKNADGFENRVLKAVWSEGKSKLVQLVSSVTTFGGNILMPEGYTPDATGLDRLQKDINDLLTKGDLVMYGFVVSVKEATDGEHTKVKNLANDHVIENFPRAWDSDDRQACLNAVKRDVAKSIDKGKLEFAD